MRARIVRCLALASLLAAPACGPQSALVNLWIDADHPRATMNHLLVVALWHDPDARSVWEERFAEVLEKSDAKVRTSYLELSTSMPDSAAVFREARRLDCDGVIVIHAHVMDRDSFYLPGFTMPREMKSTRWHREHGADAWRGDSGGSGWPALRCDVELWSSGDRNGMVWSGTTEVVDAGDDDHAAYEVADTVVSELSRLGLVSLSL